MITIYPKCTQTTKPSLITVEKAVERIKTGKTKYIVDIVRNAESKKEASDAKKELPAYSWSGTFKKRSDEALIAHSGLFCMDLDDVENIEQTKSEISKIEFTHIAFISPSGKGLKVVCRIPANNETHKESGRALFKHYSKWNFDKKQLDVSRLCFDSFDSEIYYNPNSEIFTGLLAEEKPVLKTVQTVLNDDKEIVDRLKKWMDKRGDYFVEGNRNNHVYRLLCACNRFGVDADYIYNVLLGEYQSTDFPSSEIDTLLKSVYKGKASQFATAHFDRHERVVDNGTKEEIRFVDINDSTTVTDVIYVNDIEEEMINTFLHGKQTGTTTYFETIDRHWTWKKKEITLMHGIGNEGKSTMITQLMLIKSVRDGAKWAIFSPEQFPPVDFFDDLIQAYIGKSTDKRYVNVMSLAEYKKGIEFMKEHFFYIFPESEAPTPEYIQTRFEECIGKHGVIGCLTDPFNQLENDMSKLKRDDQYISMYLGKKKRFAQVNDIYDLTCAHPKGDIKKNPRGDFEMPDVYDLAGGAMWNNKMDNILVTHRPFKRSNPNDPLVTFGSQKIKKQKLVGVLGNVDLAYDFPTGRYFEFKNGIKTSPFGNPMKVDDENYETKKEIEKGNLIIQNSTANWDAPTNETPF